MSIEKYNPEGFALKIFKDRYALHPNETFDQACKRVSEYMASAEEGEKIKHFADRFYDIMSTNRFSPGGRIWRGAGRKISACMNCFSGKTIVQTKDGPKYAKDLVDKEVFVLSKNSKYRNSKWFSGGIQQIYEVIMEDGTIIETTENHLWPVYKNGKSLTRVKTTELKDLRLLMISPKYFKYNENDYREGVRHGLTFGDGYLYRDKKYTRIDQFGDSIHLMYDFFEEPSYQKSINGVVKLRLPSYYKSFPSINHSKSYLRGFMAGWIGADGHVDKFGNIMLHNYKKENLEYAKKICKEIGLLTFSIKLDREINPFDKTKINPLYKMFIAKSSAIIDNDLDERLIIKNKHRENFRKSNITSKTPSMKVLEVNPTQRLEEVFCCNEPETHTFVIDNYYLTSNCFVLPSEDSRAGWGELIKNVTIISGLGGGIGISFDNIRPRGTEIKGTGGVATGAVSLMKIINSVCNELREGGGRRSALLFGLSYNHPDIEEFLHVKLDKKELNNANISVLVDDKFFDLVEKDKDIELKWQDKTVKVIKAKWLYNKVIENSLQTGDPGFLNIGLAEQMNNLYYCRKLSVSNPCGEQMLPPYSVCCLGAVVLSSHVKENGEIDWSLLDDTVRLGVRFLDNVIDKNEYPLPIIKDFSQKERRIGLGIMGLHHMLVKMGIKYSSKKALEVTEEVMSFIKKKAYDASIFLSVEKGQFPLLDRQKFIESGFAKKSLTPSIRKKITEYGIRNCFILTIAPTGTTSIMASCSSGVEPIFAPVYERRFNQHKDFHSTMTNQSKEIVVDPLLKHFIDNGKDTSNFEGSHDISPDQHCEVQTACQKHLDNAVSKTINLPSTANEKQLSSIILKYIRNLKGMTIYRDQSKGESPLMPLPTKEAEKYIKETTTKVESSDNSCPGGRCEV